MNADLPLIDIGVKLVEIDREMISHSQLSGETSQSLIGALARVGHAYLTLTSSHLDQLRRSCDLPRDGRDVIRYVERIAHYQFRISHFSVTTYWSENGKHGHFPFYQSNSVDFYCMKFPLPCPVISQPGHILTACTVQPIFLQSKMIMFD